MHSLCLCHCCLLCQVWSGWLLTKTLSSDRVILSDWFLMNVSCASSPYVNLSSTYYLLKLLVFNQLFFFLTGSWLVSQVIRSYCSWVYIYFHLRTLLIYEEDDLVYQCTALSAKILFCHCLSKPPMGFRHTMSLSILSSFRESYLCTAIGGTWGRGTGTLIIGHVGAWVICSWNILMHPGDAAWLSQLNDLVGWTETGSWWQFQMHDHLECHSQGFFSTRAQKLTNSCFKKVY